MSLRYTPKQPISRLERHRFLDAAVEIAQAAGRVILPYFREPISVENKAGDAGFDPVTVADKTAETVIRDLIRQRFPGHGLFGEEHGHEAGNGLTWVIDPIDGTRAFMTGMVHWGVLIALFDGQTPVLGVMHQPFTGEIFLGTNDRAEYRRGDESRPLRVRPCAALSEAVLTSTDPQLFAPGAEQAAFDALREEVRMARFGGDCYAYCLLAMGQLDLVAEANLKPYDIQALMPIIRGAGGVVTTWEGGDPAMGGRVLAAGDERIHAAAMRVLGQGVA